MNLSIRKGTYQDAKDVVEVNTKTWFTTYKGLIPDELLEKRLQTKSERTLKIENQIKEKDNLYVAVDDGKVVGIMTYGESRNSQYPNSGEIYSLYVLKEYQGHGLGKDLFMLGIKELINKGYTSMILNVLDGNKTIYFYEKYGGKKVSTKQAEFHDIEITEHVMYYENLKDIYKEFNN